MKEEVIKFVILNLESKILTKRVICLQAEDEIARFGRCSWDLGKEINNIDQDIENCKKEIESLF